MFTCLLNNSCHNTVVTYISENCDPTLLIVKIYDPVDIDLNTKPSRNNNQVIDKLISIAEGNI